jgi:hypothetical protein
VIEEAWALLLLALGALVALGITLGTLGIVIAVTRWKKHRREW